MADLPTEGLGAGRRVDMTFYWPEAARWEGRDFRVVVQVQGRTKVPRYDSDGCSAGL